MPFSIKSTFVLSLIVILQNMMMMNNVEGQMTMGCPSLMSGFGSLMYCTCAAGFGLMSGIYWDVSCYSPKEICFGDMEDCGYYSNYTTRVYRNRRRSSKSKIMVTIDQPMTTMNGMYGMDSMTVALNIKHDVMSQSMNAPVLSFASCSASVRDEACRNCTVCSNKKSVKPDCSNIPYYDMNYPPPSRECIGYVDEVED